MLVNGLKNFFKNMLCIFVPMGIVYLFLLLITYMFLANLVSNAGTMISDLFKLFDESIENSGAVLREFFDYATAKIDWNAGFFDVIKHLFDTNWISETVTGFLQTLDKTVEGFTSGINGIIGNFMNSTIAALVVAIVILVIGVAVASTVTGYFVRRRTAKRNIKQFLVNWLLSPVFNAVISAALVFVAASIKGYALLVAVAIVVVYEILSLLIAWFIYRDKTIKLSSVINIKNLMLNIVFAIVVIAIDIAAFAIVFLINAFTAILLFVPLLIYSFKIIDFNAESYIVAMIKKNRVKSAEAVESTITPVSTAEPVSSQQAEPAAENR